MATSPYQRDRGMGRDTQQQDPWKMYMDASWQQSLAKGKTKDALGQRFASTLFDPLHSYRQWNQAVSADPRIQQSQGRMDTAYGGMGSAMSGYGSAANQYYDQSQAFLANDMDALRGQAYGEGPSYADAYGAAQRQQAMGDIARQAAMGARGGMSAADRRNAIMQQSNVGANMASQIAAMRQQERQQAMQQYLGAQQAQLAARESGVAAKGQVFEGYGKMYDAAGQGYNTELGRFGGTAGLGHTTFSQQAGVVNPDFEGKGV
jgi:hypothetical protein